MTGAEILLNTLKAQGLTTMYGIVGREAEFIMFNEAAGFNFVLTHDERSAAFMADMQGRLTGKAGVCYSTFGPGATNLVTGVASAYLDRAPMLAISAQVEQQSIHASTHQYVDQVALMRPIVKYAKEITALDELEPELIRAVAIAENGLPGPCFVSIPWNIFLQEGVYRKLTLNEADRTAAALFADKRKEGISLKKNTLSDLLDFLRHSKHPVCIVGSNIFNNGDRNALKNILNHLKIPVVTTYGGKRNYSCLNKNYVGTVSKYLDFLSPNILKQIFNDADSIILIGIDMVEGVDPTLWGRGKKKKICAINSLIKNGDNFIPADLILQEPYKDIGGYVRANARKNYFHASNVHNIKEQIESGENSAPGKGPALNALSVVRILNTIFSPDDIIITDVGIHKQIAALFYETRALNNFFCSNGLACMGFGLPAAIGAKKSCGQKRVVAVCGDAGFHLSSCELETSKRYGLPVICLVFYDASAGLIRHYQKKGFKTVNPKITDFGKIDFVQLAEANGCRGYRASSAFELTSILKKELNADTTVVIEIPLSKQNYIF